MKDLTAANSTERVNDLTSETWRPLEQRGGINRRIATLLSLLALTSANSAAASEWQSVDEIVELAQSYAQESFSIGDQRLVPTAGKLDRRLKLAACDRPLTPFVRDNAAASARTVVGIRCSGSRPWKIYVPVTLRTFDTALVARKALPANHVLTSDDLVVEDRDVTRENNGYLSELDEAVGRRLKQRIPGGRVLSPTLLTTETLVRRGQSVTLTVASGDLSIKMAGKALSDGTRNQRIRVENLTSGRVVEGIVRSPEQVEILVHP